MASTNRLSAMEVARLGRPGRYADGGGLYLQISKWKTKAWLFRFERNGRERQMGLGSTDIVSLADARERARAARLILLDGGDPIEHRKDGRRALLVQEARRMTFAECAATYVELHSPSWRNPKHRAQWTSTLRTYAFPIVGSLPVQDLDTDLVVKVLQPIWVNKTETANRLRGRIEKILDWAAATGRRPGENPARWRALKDLLPDKGRLLRESRRQQPALPFREMPRFVKGIRRLPGTSARALEFLILTVSRTSEVISARAGEFDLLHKLWTVPKERMKSGREHQVPLSAAALRLLKSLPFPTDSDSCVFAGRRAGQPLSNMAMLELLRRLGRDDIVVHGFRSTFKDWAAETTHHENIVTEMALAH